MTVRILKGDLLQSDCDVIMHQANCHKTMGAGIALAIRKVYNEAYVADCSDPRTPEDKLGNYTFAECEREPQTKYVFNLYGQLDFAPRGKTHTNYAQLNNAICRALGMVERIEEVVKLSLKIGMPYGMGCGLAGGDWDVVLPMLNRIAGIRKIDIFLYQIEAANVSQGNK